MMYFLFFVSLVFGAMIQQRCQYWEIYCFAAVVYLVFLLCKHKHLARVIVTFLLCSIIGYVNQSVAYNPPRTGDICTGYTEEVYAGGVSIRVIHCESGNGKGTYIYGTCYGNGCPGLYTKVGITILEEVRFGIFSGKGRIIHTPNILQNENLWLSIQYAIFKKGLQYKDKFYYSLLDISNEEVASFGVSILFGNTNLPIELKGAMRSLGILHMVAISGINIQYLLKGSRRLVGIKGDGIVYILLLSIVGPKFTLLRAIGSSIAKYILETNGFVESRYTFLLVFSFSLLFSPSLLTNISFWLVFGACVGIYVVNPRLEQLLRIRNVLLSEIRYSFGIWGTVAPFLFLYFKTIQPQGVIWTILLGPYIEYVTLVGYGSFVGTLFVPWASRLISLVYATSVTIVLGLIHMFHD